jgi:alpha-galactosidase
MSADTYRILTNSEIIAVNQDPLGVQGNKRVSVNGLEVWAGPLSGGNVAVVLLNRNEQMAEISFTFDQVGLTSQTTCLVRDLWQHANLGSFAGSFSANVKPHGVVMVTLQPTN